MSRVVFFYLYHLYIELINHFENDSHFLGLN